MKNSYLRPLAYILIAIVTIMLASSCRHREHRLSAKESAAITDSVNRMITNIRQGLATKGPIIWLDYFDNAPNFSMITDGRLSFPNYAAAKSFIQDTLVKNVSTIDLKWRDMHIDPINQNTAWINCEFDENITMVTGNINHFDGNFSGAATSTPGGWKLIKLRWWTNNLPR